MNSTTDTLNKAAKKALLEKMLKEKIAKAQHTSPMSKGQESLWYVYQTAPTTSAYNIASAVTIHSEINLAQLEKAINICVKRHPSLTTSYALEHGKHIQHVHTDINVDLTVTPALNLTDDALKAQIEHDYHQAFDLNQAPIIRAYAYSKKTNETIFMLVIHHIGFDASSLWVFMEELGEIYQSLQQSRAPLLQPQGASYQDFSIQQDKRLQSAQGKKNKAYWLEKLSGELTPLTLNISNPRPAVQHYQGNSDYFEIPVELSAAIKSLASDLSVTPYTVMLSAYYILLNRHSAQDDLCILSPTMGRNQPQFMRTVGYFVNPVVMRANLANNPSFIELVNQVNETVLDGLAHQDYPFSSLIEDLNPSRDASYSPLSQTSFVFQKTDDNGEFSNVWQPGKSSPKVPWAGLEIAQYPLNQQEGQFELELEVIDSNDRFYGIFKYNTALFNLNKIRLITGHFECLLSQIVSEPKRHINHYSLLTQAEKTQLNDWNATQVEYPHTNNLHQLIEQQVKQTPNNIALSFKTEHWSYQQLNERANQLAHFLIEQGVTTETKVAVCMNRSLEMVVSLLGILKAGGAYVPVDPNYPASRVEFLINDANSPLILTQDALISSLPKTTNTIIAIDSLSLTTYNTLNPDIAVTPDNLAYMIYTSGSTGNPKGTMNNHAGICNRLQWMQAEYQLDESDSILQKTPFSFDVSVWEFFWPLMTGARLVVARPEGHKDTDYLIDLIKSEHITTLHFVPSMLSIFLTHDLASSCKSLKRVICSGEALNYELQQRFFQCMTQSELHNLYGPTEAAIDVTYWQCNPEYTANIVPIGKPIGNIQIHILDSNMQPVPVGVNGELHIGGIGVARGYHNRSDLTAEKFIADPFSDTPNAKLYKTGDLVRYLPDGNIEYLQRIDNQIKLRGFRIELGEVEALICSCEGIKECVVLKQTSQIEDDYLVAYVTLFDTHLVESEILSAATQKLPAHCVPSAVVILSEMPLTPNGKTDYKKLPMHSFDDENKYIVPPRTPLERGLVSLWRSLLSIEHISITDNFFSLGGHSLLAVKLMAAIEHEFKEKLPLSCLIQNPTIEQLAQHINKGADSRWSSLVPIQEQGNLSPLFFVPGGGGNVLYFYSLAEALGNDQPFFGLQAQGLDGTTPALSSLKDIAQHIAKEIKTAKPQGPYTLGGHCVGGLIAYEASQILAQGGDEIEHLFILDAPAPHFFTPKHIDLSNEEWINIFLSTIAHMLNVPLSIAEDTLKSSNESEQLQQVKQKLAQVGIIPDNTPLTQVNGLLAVFKSNASLHYQAHHNQISVPITLLRAEEINAHYDYRCHDDDNSTLNTSSLGWSHYGPTETKLVQGDHITMLAPLHAESLAKFISTTLNK